MSSRRLAREHEDHMPLPSTTPRPRFGWLLCLEPEYQPEDVRFRSLISLISRSLAPLLNLIYQIYLMALMPIHIYGCAALGLSFSSSFSTTYNLLGRLNSDSVCGRNVLYEPLPLFISHDAALIPPPRTS